MSSITRLPFVSLLLLSSMGTLAAQSVPPSGVFGFLLSTSFTNPSNQGGAALLGLMNFDGTGKVKGTFTLEYGSGGPLPVQTITGNFAGTYSSQPDGTGSITLPLGNGMSLTLAMVIDNTGHGLELVATSCSGGNIDLSASVFAGVGAKRSTAALKGSYGFQFAFSPQPSRSVGVATFDGAGNLTWSDTFVSAGPGVSSETYTGTYSFTSNGTGTLTLAATPGQGAQTFVFASTQGGAQLLLLQTNRLGDGVSFGTAHLQ